MRGRRGFAAQTSCRSRDGQLTERDGGTCWSAQLSHLSADLVSLHFEVVGEDVEGGAEHVGEGLEVASEEGALMSRKT